MRPRRPCSISNSGIWSWRDIFPTAVRSHDSGERRQAWIDAGGQVFATGFGFGKLSVSGGLEIARLDLRNSAGRACWPSGRWSWIHRRTRHSSVALHCDRRLDEPGSRFDAIPQADRIARSRAGACQSRGAEPPAETEPGPVIDSGLPSCASQGAASDSATGYRARPFDIRPDGLNIEASALSLRKVQRHPSSSRLRPRAD